MDLEGTRVLVVEDESIIAMMIEEFLEDLGCQVVAVAARLGDAEEKAKTMAIDLATLDVNLAGQLSYPVAGVLHARRIPFVFATGYGLIGVPKEFADIPVLSKPFTQSQLANAVMSVRSIEGRAG